MLSVLLSSHTIIQCWSVIFWFEDTITILYFIANAVSHSSWPMSIKKCEIQCWWCVFICMPHCTRYHYDWPTILFNYTVCTISLYSYSTRACFTCMKWLRISITKSGWKSAGLLLWLWFRAIHNLVSNARVQFKNAQNALYKIQKFEIC